MNYICIHGHFYQPPRENPSLEAIEMQDSAYPYHDWNERVTAECYAPNATSRLLDDQQRIVELVNNYARISFNFGPTLLSWMQQKAPQVLESIREADKASQERFGGHGSAIAQVYNHMILPLAHPRDKITQVIWGIRDFVFRFGRQPEGMWLPETAVDTASLEVLAAQGIRFTILAPRQAKRVRRQESRSWKDVSGERIDPSRAYQIRLSSKKTMALFFYDGPISRAVAFERLLDDGKRFSERLLGGFSTERTWPQLSHIATDGESYGHHHHYGEMALSYALHSIESGQQAQLTNYGQFLEKYPPDHWVEIVENSSWSCEHGVERWKSNCGCNSGGHPWSQEWRGPLRETLDWLRDTLAPVFEQHAGSLLKDCWSARNDYIDVILNRSKENVQAFLGKHATHDLNHEERVSALKLLEMQRHAMLMYTSCGWFFDELSGVETVQVIEYAGRAIQLAREAAGHSTLKAQFLERLRNAKSNIPEYKDGEEIYKKWIGPAVVTMDKVTGHYAVSSLFENYSDFTKIYCYDVERGEYTVETEGRIRLATGNARVRSEITTEDGSHSFAVLHLGDHNLTGGVREFQGEENFRELREKLSAAFKTADTAEVIRALDQEFDKRTFTLRTLFRDEQRRILKMILNDTLNLVATSFRSLYENQVSLTRFLNSINVPVPAELVLAAQVALNSELREALERPDLDAAAIKNLLRDAEMAHVTIDSATLEYAMRRHLESQAEHFARNPDNLQALKLLHTMLDLAAALPFPMMLWAVQNRCFAALAKSIAHHNGAGGHREDDPTGKEWAEELSAVRTYLHIKGPGP